VPKRIEKDLEELSVNMFVSEYGLLRAVYNRLYVIIHVYYSSRRQLVVSEDTLPLEKLLQMHKNIAVRLERLNTLTKDQQFPQENFEDFAKEKLSKMHLAIGLMETAGLVGELGTYSKTIIDYMKSCCTFATKFITVLSDPGNQSLKDLKNNLVTFLGQIDVLIKQRQSSSDLAGISHRAHLSVSEAEEKEKTTVPLSGPLSISSREGVGGSTTEKLQELNNEYTAMVGKQYVMKLSDPDDTSSRSAGHEDEGKRSESTDSAIAGHYRQMEREDQSQQTSLLDVSSRGISVPKEEAPSSLVSSVDEALNILEKIDLFRSKSKALEADVNSSGTSDAKGVVAALDEEVQEHSADSSGSHKFQELLDEKYGFPSGPGL